MAKRKLKVRKPPSSRDDAAHRGGDRELDVFAHGPLHDMIERFRSRLLKEAAKTAVNRSIDANDLERAYERLLCPPGSGDWEVLNRRRVYLIRARNELPETY
jgi:hypothetical protein